jgi:hypothetical protein
VTDVLLLNAGLVAAPAASAIRHEVSAVAASLLLLSHLYLVRGGFVLNSNGGTPSSCSDGGAFANAGNLEHCARYLNQTLVTFGFPASLDLFATDPVRAASSLSTASPRIHANAFISVAGVCLLLISLGLLVFWGTNCEANDCSGFTEKQ